MSGNTATTVPAISALVRRLREFDAATLHEADGRRGALDPAIKPVDAAMVCCGPAYTVACPPGDNLMLQVALSLAPAGSVVVLTTGGYAGYGVFGDMLANAGAAKGLAGFVTDSAVRDAKSLRALGFPVFSNGLSIRGAVKQHVGPVNVPVAIGGQVVSPGDLVFGDEDGVVVIPAERVEQVLAAAEQRAELERGKLAAYHAGRTIIQVNKLAPLLADKGWVLPAPQETP